MKRTVKGNIFTKECVFSPGEICIEDGLIKSVRILNDEELSAKERSLTIIPGLVDIHSHGCMANDTCDSSSDGIVRMAEYEKSCGITSYFPTTMTLGEERLINIVAEVKKAARKTNVIKGIYLEGPFISREKCGAQNSEYICTPDYDMLERINTAADSMIKFVALAPEVPGSMECIDRAVDANSNIVFSIAHTAADYDTAIRAIQKGVKHITHLYNAMKPYNHREPGVIGAAMDTEDVEVELIADGIHVHPAVVRNTFKQFGADRVILISDSTEATGMPDGEYSLGGQKVIVKGRLVTLSDGTIAGSASTLMDCVKSAIAMGVPIEEVITSATATPAKAAGIFDITGSIEEGKRADLVILENLSVVEVICE